MLNRSVFLFVRMQNFSFPCFRWLLFRLEYKSTTFCILFCSSLFSFLHKYSTFLCSSALSLKNSILFALSLHYIQRLQYCGREKEIFIEKCFCFVGYLFSLFLFFCCFFCFSLCVAKHTKCRVSNGVCMQSWLSIWKCIIIMLVGTRAFILTLYFFFGIFSNRPFFLFEHLKDIPLHALLVLQIVFIYFLCIRFIHPFNFKAKMKLMTSTNIYVCAMKYMKIVYFIGL